MAGAAAQPAKTVVGLPVESVTVLGVKPSEATIKSFVDTRTAPTPFLGKMARWDVKICPQTSGLKDVYVNYITQRIRDIATAVGAPVNRDPACKPNIEVVFTTTPQALLDDIRKNEPEYLGYSNNSAEKDQLAKVTHPIQAWYTTATQDIDGAQQIDNPSCNNDLISAAQSAGVTQNGEMTTNMGFQLLRGELAPCAKVVHASGSRINNGLSSGLFNVLIVAEPTKLLDNEIGSLADYITMLALSQPKSLDSCQELPSISNMLAPGCANTPGRITDGDLAYLHALYKMSDGTGLEIQRDEIRLEMKKTLVTDKGG
ncbi:MAG TPA: hypothetical protein VHZ32_10320 [Rhizomicrobium sp.]|nr:hypothetical protein [Rhizomicrobium sp.]